MYLVIDPPHLICFVTLVPEGYTNPPDLHRDEGISMKDRQVGMGVIEIWRTMLLLIDRQNKNLLDLRVKLLFLISYLTAHLRHTAPRRSKPICNCVVGERPIIRPRKAHRARCRERQQPRQHPWSAKARAKDLLLGRSPQAVPGVLMTLGLSGWCARSGL